MGNIACRLMNVYTYFEDVPYRHSVHESDKNHVGVYFVRSVIFMLL